MIRRSLLACTLAIAVGTASCASPGGTAAPDRNTCAVVGGVLGAFAGAVLANKHGERETDERVGKGAVGAAAGAALGYLLCGESRPAAPRTARIEATPAEGDAPLDVSFEALVSPEEAASRRYAWDYGDGATGQGQRTTHTYRAPGAYTARVTITEAGRPSAMATARVQVRAPAPQEAAPPAPAPTRRRIVLRGIRFATASAQISPTDGATLDVAVEQLAANPDVRVKITGHTDSRGDDAYNQDLSEQRASSVLAYFARNGVSRSRLSSSGEGESRPLASNDTESGRAENRRVELDIVE